ncbi:unnamed protein product, partial [Iphiclides podalirius]
MFVATQEWGEGCDGAGSGAGASKRLRAAFLLFYHGSFVACVLRGPFTVSVALGGARPGARGSCAGADRLGSRRPPAARPAQLSANNQIMTADLDASLHRAAVSLFTHERNFDIGPPL